MTEYLRIFFGPNLYFRFKEALEDWYQWISGNYQNPPKESTINVLAAAASRFSRIGIFAFFCALAAYLPTYYLFLQTNILQDQLATTRRQTEAIMDQKELLKNQNSLLKSQAISNILNGFNPKDKASFDITFVQIRSLAHMGQFGEDLLITLAQSQNYEISKSAILTLVKNPINKIADFTNIFWEFCLKTKDKKYHSDKDIEYIFNKIYAHMIRAVDNHINEKDDPMASFHNNSQMDTSKSATKNCFECHENSREDEKSDGITYAIIDYKDYNNFIHSYFWNNNDIMVKAKKLSDKKIFDQKLNTIEEVQAYINSYAIFEVIKYFTIKLGRLEYPSYDDTLEKLCKRVFILDKKIKLPRFHTKKISERLFFATTDNNLNLYKNIWRRIKETDPTIISIADDPELFLHFDYNKGISDFKKILVIKSDPLKTNKNEDLVMYYLSNYENYDIETIAIDNLKDEIRKFKDEESFHNLNKFKTYLILDRRTSDEINKRLDILSGINCYTILSKNKKNIELLKNHRNQHLEIYLYREDTKRYSGVGFDNSYWTEKKPKKPNNQKKLSEELPLFETLIKAGFLH